jgi:hypothetical protein
MRVWLDDIRPLPRDYDTWIKTAEEAIRLLETGLVTNISLDHDLGDESVATGYSVALFLEEQAFLNNIPRVKWNIHSANPVGVQNMHAALTRADQYWSEHESR